MTDYMVTLPTHREASCLGALPLGEALPPHSPFPYLVRQISSRLVHKSFCQSEFLVQTEESTLGSLSRKVIHKGFRAANKSPGGLDRQNAKLHSHGCIKHTCFLLQQNKNKQTRKPLLPVPRNTSGTWGVIRGALPGQIEVTGNRKSGQCFCSSYPASSTAVNAFPVVAGNSHEVVLLSSPFHNGRN